MPRIRYLKPEFFTDEDLADLALEARLTFAGLWCYADKAGRLEDRPKFLKAMIFPYDLVDMEAQLETLCHSKRNGSCFIQRYQVGATKLIQILSWDKHQKPHHTEPESKLPPIPPLKGSKDKDKGKGKVHQGSTELSNGVQTVKERLKNTSTKELYNSPLFLEFWSFYPKKIGKGKAWEEWCKILPTPDEKLIQNAKKVVLAMNMTEQWQKDNGQYIPLPATWLHQRRWEDEPDGKQKPIERPRNLFLDPLPEEDGQG